MTQAIGVPSTRIRFVERGKERVLQQHFHVTFNQGASNERGLWVWLDIPLVKETEVEAKARASVEAVENFAIPTNQFVR
jgi:hypothetical protein